jgi:hypothetical protein
VALRFSRSSRLGLVPRFILFVGFDHPLESCAKTTIPMPVCHMHLACPLKEPLVGFCAPSTPGCFRTRTQTDFCLACREHLQGLVTLLAFKIPKPLGSCFIPEMSMGFPSQSLFPVTKAYKDLSDSLLPCSSSPDPISPTLLEERVRIRFSCFEAFLLGNGQCL